MGQNAGFNLQLNDTRRRFTYFVPRDWAWQQTEIEFPSTHKKLFMPEFDYHVSGIFSKNKCLTHQEIEIGSGREKVNERLCTMHFEMPLHCWFAVGSYVFVFDFRFSMFIFINNLCSCSNAKPTEK